MKYPTIRDVARMAGVSTAAVSRHLSGKKVLSAETATRIDAAVASLGYQPNLIASRLSRGRSNILGLVVSDIAYAFFAELASAVEDEAVALGYGLRADRCSSAE